MKYILFVLGAILLILAWLALTAFIIMFLWNLVIVNLFHTQTIDFWLACGIAIVLSVIGGFFKHSSSK